MTNTQTEVIGWLSL